MFVRWRDPHKTGLCGNPFRQPRFLMPEIFQTDFSLTFQPMRQHFRVASYKKCNQRYRSTGRGWGTRLRENVWNCWIQKNATEPPLVRPGPSSSPCGSGATLLSFVSAR